MRVIDEHGKQIGILSKTEALDLARQHNLDLVEVSPFAKPPVAKIIDFKKFKYQQAKKQRESNKKAKVELKQVRFTPFIAQGDLNNRLEKIKGFLKDGDRVKIVVKFVGRQITRKEFGYDLINKIVQTLAEEAVPDGEPKLQGKQLYLILNPKKKSS